MVALLKKVFGTRNDRVVKQYLKKVKAINALEPTMQGLSDDVVRNTVEELKHRFTQGVELAELLPEAFALVREASVRALGMRHFDVQLVGGMVLFDGNIAEMRTGEGKTLVATLPAFLMALQGKGVHIVTVNDYLAQRDADWMRPVFEFLGLQVGVNTAGMGLADKKQAYEADIIYGTNNEFGFDYLRDNMVVDLSQKTQRGHAFAIIDEVDSVLIDEARTPLIISGAQQDDAAVYERMNQLVQHLTLQETSEEEAENDTGDFTLDEKNQQAHLTEQGHEHVESLLVKLGFLQSGQSLYDLANITLMHHVQSALRAHYLYKCDVDYVVKDGAVVIVDEHTGRLMEGRRWSEGLHQAVEAKEGVKIESENQTLASITFQNYFRMYDKLSGMTGTADTEAFEFQQIYGLEVVVIPTNVPTVRDDSSDCIYMTQEEKYEAIIEEIKRVHTTEQPILVGTASIDSSEHISAMLKKFKIKHQVLNAKNHENEAKIVAQAGAPGAVTIATNMAGRGTDIVLGGNIKVELDEASEETRMQLTEQWQAKQAKVLEAGGLYVLGAERNESRRVDNQLRGRSGRQGDPGYTRFYLALEDDLMRIFAGDRLKGMMQRFGMERGEVLQSSTVTRVLEGAQRKVEGHNFDMRKQLIQYDDVTNDQRRLVYGQRNEVLEQEDVSDLVGRMMQQVAAHVVEQFMPEGSFEEQWDVAGLERMLASDFALNPSVSSWLKDKSLGIDGVVEKLLQAFEHAYAAKKARWGYEVSSQLERNIVLQMMDIHWKEHLGQLNSLRQGIYLRSYAQKNPMQEFKREAFDLFEKMLTSLRQMIIGVLLTAEINTSEADPEEKAVPTGPRIAAANEASLEAPMFSGDVPKVGRNELCPCGSGKKYKHCHGRLA